MKSHVSIEQHICPICLACHDTGALLFDRRFRETLERTTVTGWSPCPTHADRDFIHLIVIDEARSTHPLTLKSVYRTGEVISLGRTVAADLLTTPIESLAFINEEAAAILKALVEPPNPIDK